MNKMKNEHIIKLGDVEILLRPTFENISSLESNVGSLSYLSWKFSRREGGLEATVKSVPSMTEIAKIIFYSQASKKEDGTYKYSLDEIFDFVMNEGMSKNLVSSILGFIVKITAGNKMSTEEIEDIAEEKKT